MLWNKTRFPFVSKTNDKSSVESQETEMHFCEKTWIICPSEGLLKPAWYHTAMIFEGFPMKPGFT